MRILWLIHLSFGARQCKYACEYSPDFRLPLQPIPKEFVDAHGDALRGPARILDANGKEWTVEIGGPGKFLGFKGGWKSFVANMSVKRGEQMMFALVSKSCFLVQVFNKLGVEVVPAAAPVVAAAAPATGKRKRPEVKAEPLSDDESDDDDDDGSSDSDMSEYEASKSDAGDVSESDADSSVKVVDEELEVSKPRKRVKRKFTGSKAVTSTKPASHKKKVKEGMYIEPGSCTTTYESRRREVTAAELNRTIERAKAFKTKFPSIPVHMMPSHVYRGFWLVIKLILSSLLSSFLVHHSTTDPGKSFVADHPREILQGVYATGKTRIEAQG